MLLIVYWMCAACLIHFFGVSTVRAIWMLYARDVIVFVLLDVSLQTITFSKPTTKTLENYGKIFKNGPSQSYGRQTLENLKWSV